MRINKTHWIIVTIAFHLMTVTNMIFFQRLIIILCASFFFQQVQAQALSSFTTTTIKGDSLVVPNDFSGTKTLLFLAFTKEAEHILDKWYEPVYIMFLDESGINSMAYDCEVKLVMMFTGAGQALANGIVERLMQSVDESMTDYLLFFQGDFSNQLTSLGIKKKNDAYVLVLDEEGRVVYLDSGQYSEEKLERIAALVEL
jgi:hypothetical protein